MNNDNDLLHQTHSIQQKPNSFFKLLNPFVLFTAILFIALVAGIVGYLLGARNKQLVFLPQPRTIITQSPPIIIQQPSSFPTLSISNPSATPSPIPATSPEIDTSNWKTYRNEKLRFELTFPKGWYLPSETDYSPHFYGNEECANANNYVPRCPALEVQNQTGSSEFSEGWEARFNALRTKGRKPIKLSSLIPEAIVIKSNAPGPAEGWAREYDVFFQTYKRQFIIFANGYETLEKDIFPTFRLIN